MAPALDLLVLPEFLSGGGLDSNILLVMKRCWRKIAMRQKSARKDADIQKYMNPFARDQNCEGCYYFMFRRTRITACLTFDSRKSLRVTRRESFSMRVFAKSIHHSWLGQKYTDSMQSRQGKICTQWQGNVKQYERWEKYFLSLAESRKGKSKEIARQVLLMRLSRKVCQGFHYTKRMSLSQFLWKALFSAECWLKDLGLWDKGEWTYKTNICRWISVCEIFSCIYTKKTQQLCMNSLSKT